MVGFRTVSVPSAGKSGWPGNAKRSLPSTSMIGWVVPVILFQDLEVHLPLRVAQNNRVRLEVGRRFRETHVIDAWFQIQRHCVADDGKVLVVNGQGGRSSDRRGWGGGENQA